MSLFKCKICGGTLEITSRETVATCEYCGMKQTLPKLDDEKKANLFDRANHFRRNNDFDKAMGIYEQILNEYTEDAESYWSIVLCRYGIEYVEDPSSRKRVPTVNRAQFTSVFDDEDYKSAIKYADAHQKELYEKEATAINEIQKGILAISGQEEPFDVFICYKETDANGRRTQDSVLATELYHELTREGYKVFFSRITLEDKLGTAYEPYIFAALNSSKVMVVLGTRPEHFNAVWVKNEWSRYLALIKQGQKKMLIPAYRDMDPYDLPEEFSHLQAQDMSKLGFMQDLVRGIKKIVKTDEPKQNVVKETVISGGNTSIEPLLERAFMFLEDGDWNSTNEYCEKVLDIDPKCARAYLGKLMAELRVNTEDALCNCSKPFDDYDNYAKVMRFADASLQTKLKQDIEHINTCNENARLDSIYTRAKNAMSAANTESAYKEAARLFESVSEYWDSLSLAQTCFEKAEIERKEAERIAKRNKKVASITFPIVCAIVAFIIVLNTVIIPNSKYADAVEMYNAGEYQEAIALFSELGDYKDAPQQVENAIKEEKYNEATEKHNAGEHQEAIALFSELGDYKNSKELFKEAMGALRSYHENFDNIISAGYRHTVGLKSDGTVVAVGDNEYGQCNVESWKDIVAISAGKLHTVGLKSDGTVVAVGDNEDGQCDVESWKDIVAISAGYEHTVGLKSDGTVVAVGWNSDAQCNVKSWKDIVAISAEDWLTVGLKSDGTVVAVGWNGDGQRDVESWKDIVAISAGLRHTIGLKSDGTVVAVGWNGYSQCDVESWKDIVAISAGRLHTVGLKSDGTVVAVGDNEAGECNVWKWDLFDQAYLAT